MKKQSKQAVYELYASAWSAISDDERKRRLEGSVSPNVSYYDSLAKLKGLDELADFLARFQRESAGFSFSLNSFLQHHDVMLANWNRNDTKGQTIATGHDAIRFDEAGRMIYIIGFADLPEQQAE